MAINDSFETVLRSTKIVINTTKQNLFGGPPKGYGQSSPVIGAPFTGITIFQ
jgi:hypothetical protein